MTEIAECPSCQADPRAAPGRYCAPKRCLCGHPDCPAFPTYTARRESNVVPIHAPAVPPREGFATDLTTMLADDEEAG